jgi:thioredoxin 1
MRLLKFEAPWCTKCKQMSAIMETIEITHHVEHIDIDKNREAALYYGIRGIPHMILLDENNNIIKRIGGVLTKEKLIEELTI